MTFRPVFTKPILFQRVMTLTLKSTGISASRPRRKSMMTEQDSQLAPGILLAIEEISKMIVPKCRMCDSLAIGRFSLDRGCVVYPDDKVQNLCPQHVIDATPLGG